MTLEGFLTFRQMVTPSVLLAVYYFGALVMPLAVWWLMAKIRDTLLSGDSRETERSESNRRSDRRWKIRLVFLIFFMMGELAWRIFIEFFVAYFQMRDALVG